MTELIRKTAEAILNWRGGNVPVEMPNDELIGTDDLQALARAYLDSLEPQMPPCPPCPPCPNCSHEHRFSACGVCDCKSERPKRFTDIFPDGILTTPEGPVNAPRGGR